MVLRKNIKRRGDQCQRRVWAGPVFRSV